MGKPEPFRWSPAEAPPQIQAHSKAKLALVRSYLAKYIRRLGGERRRDIFKLDFVDGFAGGGTFTDGTTEISGSPIIMLEEAAKAETELNLDRAKPLIFDFAYYFVDKNQDHTNHLKNVLRKRQHDDSERVFVLTEEFSAACPKVIAAIKKRQPRAGRSIFLLDQFLPGRSEKIREVVCRFGAHVPIRAVWLARAADWAVRRRPGARVIRGTSASSNRTARSAGCVVNWRAPPATGTDGSVAANASRSNSTRRGGPAADRQPPLPRTGRKVAAGIPDGGLAHATVGRAAARARDRSTRPSRRRCRRRVRTAAARLT